MSSIEPIKSAMFPKGPIKQSIHTYCTIHRSPLGIPNYYWERIPGHSPIVSYGKISKAFLNSIL
jgi:hypothetical protein